MSQLFYSVPFLGRVVRKFVLQLLRLFFVEDWIESLKFGISLWFLTYVGSWFNAMTLLIMAWVGLFTIPKVLPVNRGSFSGRWTDY